MKSKEAIEHFGGVTNLASKLHKCTTQAISQWGEYPPYGRQAEIELLTKGELKRETKESREKRPCNHHPESKVS